MKRNDITFPFFSRTISAYKIQFKNFRRGRANTMNTTTIESPFDVLKVLASHNAIIERGRLAKKCGFRGANSINFRRYLRELKSLGLIDVKRSGYKSDSKYHGMVVVLRADVIQVRYDEVEKEYEETSPENEEHSIIAKSLEHGTFLKSKHSCVDCKKFDEEKSWCSWCGAILSRETIRQKIPCPGYRKLKKKVKQIA